MLARVKIMGKTKEQLINLLFDQHFIEDGDNCGSYETAEAMLQCYSKLKPYKMPEFKSKDADHYYFMTDLQKEAIDDKHLKNYNL